MLFKKSLLLSGLVLLASASFSQTGLKKGAAAPEFSAKDYLGNTVDLEQLLKTNKTVVLFFYRGVWCPYCNKQIQDLQDSLQLLTAKGAYVVGVTPQTNENIEKTADKHHSSFSMIHDEDYRIMKAYDVDFILSEDQVRQYRNYHVDLDKFNGNPDNILPVPATYVINKKRTIIYVHFDKDYSKRATIADILAAIEKS